MSVIRFYSTKDEYGCFSNFSPHPISLGGKNWPTSEHYFQAQKFPGAPDEEEIRLASSPMIAARMGRSRQRPLRGDWEAVRDRIMREAVLAKFTQHADLRAILLATGDAEIVEHTTNDRYWGDGGDGRGANRLGQILMQVREELRTERAATGRPIRVRPETAADFDAIRTVVGQAFGGDDEARLVDALRDGGHVQVSLVAECDGEVVGHILFTDLPIETPEGVVGALALAPLAVRPSHQRSGVGSDLVREGLRACKEIGQAIVVVLGHREYYPRFGFSARLAEQLSAPFSGESFMALELVEGALDGVRGEVRYPAPFGLP